MDAVARTRKVGVRQSSSGVGFRPSNAGSRRALAFGLVDHLALEELQLDAIGEPLPRARMDSGPWPCRSGVGGVGLAGRSPCDQASHLVRLAARSRSRTRNFWWAPAWESPSEFASGTVSNRSWEWPTPQSMKPRRGGVDSSSLGHEAGDWQRLSERQQRAPCAGKNRSDRSASVDALPAVTAS